MRWTCCLTLFFLLNASMACAPQEKSRRSPVVLNPPSEAADGPQIPGLEPRADPSPSLPINPEEPSFLTDGKQIIAAMGSGFNLGNLFDREGQALSRDDIKGVIDLYEEAGFRHVRIPTTWMDGYGGDHLADGSGAIKTSHPRFLDLVFTINYALSKSMHVVLNTHHEHWLKKHYKPGTSDAIFARLWHNIGQYFAQYPQELIFEVLNEPEGVFGDVTGPVSPYSAESIQLTRHINAIGLEAIRLSHPDNRERIVLIMPNA